MTTLNLKFNINYYKYDENLGINWTYQVLQLRKSTLPLLSLNAFINQVNP